jgi:hypothetical protein
MPTETQANQKQWTSALGELLSKMIMVNDAGTVKLVMDMSVIGSHDLALRLTKYSIKQPDGSCKTLQGWFLRTKLFDPITGIETDEI